MQVYILFRNGKSIQFEAATAGFQTSWLGAKEFVWTQDEGHPGPTPIHIDMTQVQSIMTTEG